MNKKFELYVKCSVCNNELFRDAEYIPQGEGVCIIVKPCPVCAAQQGGQSVLRYHVDTTKTLSLIMVKCNGVLLVNPLGVREQI